MTPARVRPPTCTQQRVDGDGVWPCIGSDCHKWVHEVQDRPTSPPRLREPNDRDVVNTGLGVCADNLRAVPWVDVAAGVKS